MRKSVSVLGALLYVLAGGVATTSQPRDAGAVVFSDDFERGLGSWRIYGDGVRLHDSGDPAHGRVLALIPNGDVFALIKRSEIWGGTRMEGEMLFPTDIDNYLGFIYNFRERGNFRDPGGRTDFGVVYVKGNDSYLQANPHRDFNVSRTIYPEARAALTGAAAITTGTWQRFAIEVVGRTCHVYVGDGPVPHMTFPHFEFDSGAIGLQPRSVGGDVWVDNLSVRRIDRLSYTGEDVPRVQYTPDQLISNWQVAGPFDRTRDQIARNPAAGKWQPLLVDERGAVTTGTIVDFHGPRSVAYFRTTVASAASGDGQLQISTADDLALWVNGRFEWFIPRQDLAWFDFFRNPKHQGQTIPIRLQAGTNDLVLRLRGGTYASGGFFARVAGAP